jgi:hypothetical protein
MKKVASGEPLNRSAGDWNRLVDLANNSPQQSPGGVFSRRFGPGVDPGDKHNRVRVKNGSGAARRRGEVLQLDDQLTAVLDPAYVGLLGGKPAAGYHCFGILQGDVPADEIGVAAVSGAHWPRCASMTSTTASRLSSRAAAC